MGKWLYAFTTEDLLERNVPWVKVGETKKSPEGRVAEWDGGPSPNIMFWKCEVPDKVSDKTVHEALKRRGVKRLRNNREWFELPDAVCVLNEIMTCFTTAVPIVINIDAELARRHERRRGVSQPVKSKRAVTSPSFNPASVPHSHVKAVGSSVLSFNEELKVFIGKWKCPYTKTWKTKEVPVTVTGNPTQWKQAWSWFWSWLHASLLEQQTKREASFGS